MRPGRTSAWWENFVAGIVTDEEWSENFSNDSQSVLTLVWETLYTWVTLSKSSTSSSDQTKDSVFPSAFPLPLDLDVFLLEFAMIKSTWKFQSRGSEQHDVKLNKDGAETWLSRAQMFNNAHALWVKSSVFKSYSRIRVDGQIRFENVTYGRRFF